jgi:hypothetical protein
VTIVTLTLLGLAIADLIRWVPDGVSWRRTVAAGVGGVAAVATVAALIGTRCMGVAIAGGLAAFVLGVWLVLGKMRPAPGWSLAWIAAVLLVSFGASGSAPPVEGALDRWYSGLGFEFTEAVTVEQFLLGCAGALFLLSTANRIVRLVLDAAGTPAETGEATLRGGRLLGPMERLIVAALVVAGDPAGLAFVIAAKGLLRLPEIRTDAAAGSPDDNVTEYFLVGTFTSLLLAGALGLIVLAAV